MPKSPLALDALVDPFARYIPPRTDAEKARIAKREDDLNVTAGYRAVAATGILDIDVSKHVRVDWKRTKLGSPLIRDAPNLSRAYSAGDDDFDRAFDALFYVVGSTYGGDLVVQFSASEHVGKLARLEYSQLGDHVVDDGTDVVALLPELIETGRISISECTLEDWVRLRVGIATKQKAASAKKFAKTLDAALETAKDSKKLELVGLVADALPESVLALTSLENLTLEECDIVALPEAWEAYESLESIWLDGCPKLTRLPDALPDLQRVWIADTPIEALPDHRWSNLVTLTLKNTKLSALPAGLGDSKISSLSVDGAPLRDLPADVGRWTTLTSLTISACPQVTHLPDTVCDLPALATLEVYDTGLCELPERIGSLNASLTRLVLGSWGSNELTRLPESICALEKLNLLWLANNQLEALPRAIGNLKNLSYFSAENNRLTELPESFFDLSPIWLKLEFSFHDNPIDEALMKSYKKRINQGYKKERASQ